VDLPLLHGLTAFIISYALLVAASSRGAKAFYSILVMVVSFIILATTPRVIESSVIAFFSWNDIRAIAILYFSLMTAGILKEVGVLDRLLKGASKGGCRFGGIAVPSLVGLLPMPGGALVSAIIVRDRYLKELKLDKETSVYLNFWFRHIWVPVWPLFQALIISAAVLGIKEGSIIRITWPAGISSLIAGVLVALVLLRGKTCHLNKNASLLDLLYGLWPFILIATLVIFLNIDMVISIIITLILVAFYYKPSMEKLRKAILFASTPTIIGVVALSLIFKEVLVRTSAPTDLLHLAESSGLNPYIVSYLVTFIAGIAAGGEAFFAATAIPLLLPLIEPSKGLISAPTLLAAFTGGYMGVMVSPVHLCLALTVEYFQARLSKSILLSSIAAFITTIIVMAYIFLL